MSAPDHEILSVDTPFQGFFRVDRFRLRHRRFAGDWTPVLEREIQSRKQRREQRERERRPPPEAASRPPRGEKPKHRRRDRSGGPRPKYPKSPR